METRESMVGSILFMHNFNLNPSGKYVKKKAILNAILNIDSRITRVQLIIIL